MIKKLLKKTISILRCTRGEAGSDPIEAIGGLIALVVLGNLVFSADINISTNKSFDDAVNTNTLVIEEDVSNEEILERFGLELSGEFHTEVQELTNSDYGNLIATIKLPNGSYYDINLDSTPANFNTQATEVGDKIQIRYHNLSTRDPFKIDISSISKEDN